MKRLPEKYDILNMVEAAVCVVADGELYRNRKAEKNLGHFSDGQLTELFSDSRAMERYGVSVTCSEFEGAQIYTVTPLDSDTEYAARREIIKNICLVCAYSEGTMDGVYYAVSETRRMLGADCAALYIADEEAGMWKSTCLCTADGNNDGLAVKTDLPLGELVPVEKILDKKSCTILTNMPEAAIISGSASGVCAARVSGGDVRAILWIERQNPPENWAVRETSFIYLLVGVLRMALRRSRMERELMQALRQAEAASKAKTEFLSSVSHEIRTPINAVLGMTRLAMDTRDMNEIYNSLKIVEAAGGYLLGIINDILDISRVEAGKLSLSPEDYILREMMSSVRDMISFAAGAKGLHFSCECAAELPECLYGDSQRVSQVLINLLNNAVKFTEKGEVRLYASREGDMLRFDVSDTGIGIKKEDYDKLFVAFERLEDNVVRRSEGTGLGLRITKSIVELMGGSITVKSTFRKGSTFTVLLPLHEGDKSNVLKALSVSFTAPKARILVADDNEVNRRVTVGMLRKLGVKCDTASNGREAVKLACEKHYDLIFMDHMMPVMDGDEACRRIRAESSINADIPILALTANAVVQAQQGLIAAGMNDVITKPVAPEKLGDALLKWLPERLIEKEAGVSEPQSFVDGFGIPGVRAEEAAERMGVGREFYIEALRLTVQTLPAAIAEQREKLRAGDMKGLRIGVHGVKGALNTIGASEAASLAQSLEYLTQTDETERISEMFEEYEAAIGRLGAAINKFLEE